MRRVDLFAVLCLTGATLSWGATPVMIKVLTQYIPDGFTANAIRYPLACLLYLPLLIQGARLGMGRRFWLIALVPAGINLAGQTLWAMSPYYLSAGMIAFLLRLSTIWAILGAFCLFPDERRLAFSKLFWSGAMLALGGFLIMSWAQDLQMSEGHWVGLIIMFFCAICYGMYGVTVRYAMGSRNPLFVFSVVGSYTSIGLILIAPVGKPESLLELSAAVWVLVVVSAVVGIAMAHGMYYAAVQRIGAAVSMLMLSVTPFVTIIGSAIVLGERFSLGQWIGGCVLVLGATVAMTAQQRLPHHPLPDPHEIANE
jgi:drug/metabolite transporter (DMT)-like permease